jgi:hypothetical protein
VQGELVVRKHLLLFVLLALLFGSAAVVVTQTEHITPFTGTWKLNLAKSRFNPGPPPFKSFTLTFTPDGTRTLDLVRANGQPLKASLPWSDGKEVPMTIHPGTLGYMTGISTIQGNTFNETLKENGKIVEKIHGVVSSDERTLTITVEGHTFHNLLIFEKQ